MLNKLVFVFGYFLKKGGAMSKIVVLGAGIAGHTAASYLRK